MQYTAPHYYKRFHCTGGSCEDTCCAGWQIAIDESSLKKYRKWQGSFGNRLRNEINWEEKIFHQYHGRCAFLNEENLCDIYVEGKEALFCRTCRLYPRHIEEFEGLREISLSMSCPAAAELILGCREPVHFIRGEKEGELEEDPEFDFLLFTKLMDARDVAFVILQDRTLPIGQRLSMLLALAHDLQERIDKNAVFQIDSVLERYSSEEAKSWFSRRLERIPDDEEMRKEVLGNLFVILNHMETLRADWRGYLQDARELILDGYAKKDLRRSSAAKPGIENWEILTEQLMAYFVYTYFCGAVYDGDAYGRMKFAFAGTVLVREIAYTVGVRRGEGAFRDFTEAARRYAREIEHSDFNKCKMQEMLHDEKKFGLEKLFLLRERRLS